jgi:hypothetical protein
VNTSLKIRAATVGAAAMLAIAGSRLFPAYCQESTPAFTSAHVDVMFDRGVSEAEASKVGEFLEKQFVMLREQLGCEPTAKIEARVYESVGRFLSQAGLRHPWRLAIYSRGVLHVQPVSALLHRGMFEKALSYEFARAYLAPVGAKGCPPWLIESFAVYHANELSGLTSPIGAKLSAFSDLAQDLQDYPEPPQRDDVHFILGQTMKYLVKQFGEKKAFALFGAFDGTTTVETAFKKVLGEEYGAVEKGWAKYIAEQTKPFRKQEH